MSGHSKWAQIRRQKGVNDAKRGQMFTKVGREITVAARQGGGDPNANYRLRLAVQKAKQINMPQENIERAIKRGAGGSEGAALEEFTYEGYGPAGVALLLEVATDNRNRAAAEIRNVFPQRCQPGRDGVRGLALRSQGRRHRGGRRPRCRGDRPAGH